MLHFFPFAGPSGMEPSRERLALFGGTFDPIHRGHLQLALKAKQSLSLDRVIFIPCAISPFKTDAQPRFTGKQRLEMVRQSLTEIDPDGSWANATDYEIDRPPPSYSWQTVEHFDTEANAIYWILGTDQWEQIDRWARADWLRENVHFIVVTREGNSVRDREGWHYSSLPFSHPASSSAIRRGEFDTDWLPDSVAVALA